MTLTWVRDAAERAVKTAAQTAVALLAADGTSVLTLDWRQAAAVIATATAVSVLTSVGSLRLGVPGTASAVRVPGPAVAPQPLDGTAIRDAIAAYAPDIVRQAAEHVVPDLVDTAASQLRAQLDDALSRGLSVDEISRRIGGPR